MNVWEKLMNVQTKLKAPKNQYNGFGKYNYRSCEDILEGLKPILAEVKAIVILKDEIVQFENRIYVKATAVFMDAEKGEMVQTSALAREDETKKGMDLAQVTGSVSSYARKYALNGLFCIDDTKDSDATNTHGKEKKDTPKTQQEVSQGTQPTSNTNTPTTNKSLSDAQVKRLFAIANGVGHNADKVKAAIMQKYGISEIHSLTKEQYDHVCQGYEALKKVK